MSCLIRIIVIVISLHFWGSGSSKADHAKVFSVVVPDIELLLKKDAYGIWRGPLVDALEATTAEAHIDFEYIIVPFPRAVKMVENGAVHFGIFLKTKQRDAMATPTIKLGNVHYLVVSRADHPITNKNQLNSIKVGRTQSGSKAIPLNFITDENLSLYRQHSDLVKALLINRVQAIILPDFRFIEALNELKISPKRFAKPFKIMSQEMWVYSSKQNVINEPLLKKITQNISTNTAGLFDTLMPQPLKE